MKRFNCLKSIGLSLLLAGMGMACIACSGDDTPVETTKPKETVKLDADTIQVFEGFTIKFQMLNASGLPVTTFKEGEDITFKLVITNSRDDRAAIPGVVGSEYPLIGNNTFNIYSVQGEDLGHPWDWRYGRGLGNLILKPGQSIPFLCSAFGQDEYDPRRDNPEKYLLGDSWCAFIKTDYPRTPLPKGQYYTKFEINLNSGGFDPSSGYKGVECRKDFRIE